MSDIHEQLRALLDHEGARYRVIEHAPEGRTEVIAKIRGNQIEQSIKSMVLQVRVSRKENIYCLANVPGHCRVVLDGVRKYFDAEEAAIRMLREMKIARFGEPQETARAVAFLASPLEPRDCKSAI